MNAKIAIATICLFATASLVTAAGLAAPDSIDRVLFHPRTKQAALVLTVDRPLDVEENERRLQGKVDAYISFVESGRLQAMYSHVDPNVQVLIAIVFEMPPPPLLLPKLLATKAQLQQKGFEVRMQVYDQTINGLRNLEP